MNADISGNAARTEALADMRKKHGFQGPPGKKSGARKWSKKVLGEQLGQLILQLREELGARAVGVTGESHTRNGELLNLLAVKFAPIGFRWRRTSNEVRSAKDKSKVLRIAHSVHYDSYPTVSGVHITLADMVFTPVELCDQFKGTGHRVAGGDVRVDLVVMKVTGIGYKGLGGVSWHPMTRAFPLPTDFEGLLMGVGSAIFHLSDAVTALWPEDRGLRRLLEHRVPDRIPRLVDTRQSVRLLRPDMVVVRDGNGLRPVITEIESCPAGHGMVHAMQLGYGLSSDMVDVFVRHLAGRPYTVVATHEWSEYVFDQAAFCAALRQRGVDACIVFDRPLSDLASGARRWEAPKGVQIASWDTDILGRLERLGFLEFVSGVDSLDPLEALRGVIFRFGYFDNFSAACEILHRLGQRDDVEIVNPASFFFESKALMAAAKLPSVRAWIAAREAGAVDLLDQCLAETRVLGVSDDEDFINDRAYWVSKFGAWDGNNQSWGARSLAVGSSTSATEWDRLIRERRDLPHPVVMQHVINSGRWDVEHLAGGERKLLIGGRTRLTPFLVRDRDGRVHHGGSMMTLRADTIRVHGATDAVEAPVIFTDTEGK